MLEKSNYRIVNNYSSRLFMIRYLAFIKDLLHCIFLKRLAKLLKEYFDSPIIQLPFFFSFLNHFKPCLSLVDFRVRATRILTFKIKNSYSLKLIIIIQLIFLQF